MKVATLTIELDGENCFVVANGIRIAKRGKELNWISLEPGWAVYSPPNHKITYNDVVVRGASARA